MKKDPLVIRETLPLMAEKFGDTIAQAALAHAQSEWEALCRAHPGQSKAVQKFTVQDVYPCIALYHGLMAAGIGQKQALAFMDWSYSKRSEKKARSMRSMMKLPGAYKLMPRMFRFVAVHQFGEAAGFKAKYYDTGNDRVKFDMTECAYCCHFRENGCPELIPCLCHTDDVCNAHMHEKLIWHRTQTMGEGGSLCDFELYIDENAR